MLSEKQIEANRRNARKSTGPKTAEGKAAVRLNALRHGLRARTVVLPTENADDFHQLCADLESEFQPRTRAEQILVEEMAVSHWKLARLETGERSIYTRPIPVHDQMALIGQLSQCEARLKRSFIKAMRELEHLQKTRHLPSEAEPREAAAQDPAPPDQAPAPAPVTGANYGETSCVMAPEPVAAPPISAPPADPAPGIYL
jgi:hypothetical protein